MNISLAGAAIHLSIIRVNGKYVTCMKKRDNIP